MTRFRYNEKGYVLEEVYYGYNKQLDKEYIGSYKKYEYDENGWCSVYSNHGYDDAAEKYAEEYVRVREKAFHEEMTNATEVVDARLALSKVRIERLEAMYGFDKTLSQILQYAGISEQFSSYQNKQGVITESYQSKN